MPTSPTTRPSVAGYGAPRGSTAAPLLVASTGGSTTVITAARLVAERLGGVPEIVAVREPIPVYLPGMGMEPMLPAMDAEQRRQLLDGVAQMVETADDGDPSWRLDVVDGPAARTIARVARERGARMIVMGIGRHAPMDRVFGGETALQTLRVADRPVLAVAPSFIRLPRHAVVAVDFSAASLRAAEEALALLADGGTLSLVHVRTPLDVFGRLDAATLNSIYAGGIERLFERLGAGLSVPRGVTIERVILAGDPVDELLTFGESRGADLIATGSSGLGFFDRLVVGSVATRLIRRATVSVLAVPRPSAAEAERVERRLSGTDETSEEARWPALVEAFSERNAGRPTRLEIDDPSLGAQLQEVGHLLLGVAYDRRDGRLEIMLGAPMGGGRRLMHSIGDVTSIAVLTGAHGRDVALQARHGQGQTILMFQDQVGSSVGAAAPAPPAASVPVVSVYALAAPWR